MGAPVQPRGAQRSAFTMIDTSRMLIVEHLATIRGVAGVVVAESLEHVSPLLTVLVLGLTAFNLVLEIRKKMRK